MVRIEFMSQFGGFQGVNEVALHYLVKGFLRQGVSVVGVLFKGLIDLTFSFIVFPIPFKDSPIFSNDKTWS